MNIKEIEAAYWTNQKAQEAAASLAREFLNKQAPGADLSTTTLVRALGGKDITRVSSHLSNARNSGLLDGYFRRDEKHTSFGKPRVLWGLQPGVVRVSEAPIVSMLVPSAAEFRALMERLAAEKGMTHDEYMKWRTTSEDDLTLE